MKVDIFIEKLTGLTKPIYYFLYIDDEAMEITEDQYLFLKHIFRKKPRDSKGRFVKRG